MIKGFVSIILMIISMLDCSMDMKTEIEVYVESGKYGWYFVFIENIDEELNNQEQLKIDLTNENFALIELNNRAKYKMSIYDKYTNQELSNRMKIIKYTGDINRLQCLMFYYPDISRYPDYIFDTDFNDPTYEIRRNIERDGDVIFDSILKEQNLYWKYWKYYK